MNNPIVSVVIPVFNNQNTICETLNSLVAQTMSDWEAICVDDGSTDDSVAVVEKYISEHPDNNLRLVRRNKVEKGGSVCRNIGGSLAQGEYLVFLDADDLLSETCLDNRIKTIENTSNQFVVFPMAAFEEGHWPETKMYSRLYVRDPLYFFITGFGTWQVTSPIIRKCFFDRLGGYDESFPRLQDVEFHIRAIIESEGHYLVCKESAPDCFYRQASSSSVLIEKLKRTMSGAEKLVELIESYEQNRVFSNQNKFSLSLVSLYCHFCYYLNMIILSEPDYKGEHPLLKSNLMGKMSLLGKWTIYFVEVIPSGKAKIFCCRAIDKIIRKKLAK